MKQRIEYKLLMLLFRSLHGLAASHLTDLFTRHHPTCTLRSADAHLLEVNTPAKPKTPELTGFSSEDQQSFLFMPVAGMGNKGTKPNKDQEKGKVGKKNRVAVSSSRNSSATTLVPSPRKR
ncbi:hypothetical protein LSAT2_004718 [Lamellibrachia satsuma]|nr:hypothetical protein LSAT2_004718 [Lamellibrachia satsuma]